MSGFTPNYEAISLSFSFIKRTIRKNSVDTFFLVMLPT